MRQGGKAGKIGAAVFTTVAPVFVGCDRGKCNVKMLDNGADKGV